MNIKLLVVWGGLDIDWNASADNIQIAHLKNIIGCHYV